MKSYEKLVNEVYTLEKAKEYYEDLKKSNYTEEQIDEIIEECLYVRNKMKENKKKEPREITSSTYERCQKRLNKEVNGWLTGRN